MQYKTQKTIGIAILFIAVLIQAYSLIYSESTLWDVGILLALLGIIINDVATQTRLRRYEDRYGEL